MGRWATIKRRFSSSGGAVGLEPPPAPSLDLVVENLIQTNAGLPNTGGDIRMYSSPDANPPWSEYGTFGWALVFDWGDKDDLPSAYLVVTSIGNGTAYVGESPMSNVYDNLPA